MEKETKYVLEFSALLATIPLLSIIPYIIFEPAKNTTLLYLGIFFTIIGFYYFKKFHNLYQKPFFKLSIFQMKMIGIPLTLAICGVVMVGATITLIIK